MKKPISKPITVCEAGHRGGIASAKARSPAQRSAIARRAVNERWRRYRERNGATHGPAPAHPQKQAVRSTTHQRPPHTNATDNQ